MPAPTVQKLSVRQLAGCGYRRPRDEMESYRLSVSATADSLRLPSGKDCVFMIPALKMAKRKKVAAYCRVSTGLDSQESSIESQKMHYHHLILSHPEWAFAGIYIDTGISGTKTDTRPALQRLLKDCREGRVNMILTKSISRFARNLTECLRMIRDLKKIHVFILFEKEHIHTGEMSSELMLSLLSCFAEEESRSISRNLKWGIRKRFQDGTFVPGSVPYGFLLYEGKMVIKPEEASVVRQIFTRLLEGHGLLSIADYLNRHHIPSSTGALWTQSSIRQIVRNPAYTGDLLLQKTYTDVHFHARSNRGQLNQYLYENHHEGIVDRDAFNKVQALIKQRAAENGYQEGKNPNRSGNRYPFTHVLYCKTCSSVMHRQAWSPAQAAWICSSHKQKMCSMLPQSESDLKNAFITCLNKIAWSQKRRKTGNRILDVFAATATSSEALTALRRLISRWKITSDSASFPARQFTALVDHCTVDAGKTVTFHFRCGLTLTESLIPSTYTVSST